MKNYLKISMLAIAVSISAIACDPSTNGTTGTPPDSLAVDSPKIDSAKANVDTTQQDKTATPTDTIKKDSVKK